MATATYVHDGDSIDYTPSGGDVAAGDVVALDNIIGIAKRPIPADTLGSLAVVGVYDFPKDTGSGTDLAEGEAVTWDAENEVMEPAGSLAPTHGHVVKAASESDETVRVRLSQ